MSTGNLYSLYVNYNWALVLCLDSVSQYDQGKMMVSLNFTTDASVLF